MSNRIMVADLEVKVTSVEGEIDNSPKNPANYAVSAHWLIIEDGKIGPVSHLVWKHNEKAVPDSRAPLQEALDSVDALVFFNSKFDVSWLLEMDFTLPGRVECAMVREFLLAQARPWRLSLKETAERRDVTRKKSELVDELFKSGTGFEAMPLDTVLEYAEADVISCAEIYLQQEEEFNDPANVEMLPALRLANDLMYFLVRVEDNGCRIDLDVLAQVEQDFITEAEELTQDLEKMLLHVMGDTPINIRSGEHMSKVFYGREMVDKELHKKIFNIGVKPNGKPLPVPRMNQSSFNTAVRTSTVLVDKTVVQCCDACDGRGKIQKFKVKWRQKDGVRYSVPGEPYKNLSNCDACKGVGAFYVPTGQRAGLKLVPEGPRDASATGFKTDKHTIKRMIAQAQAKNNDLAVEFLTKYARLNAIHAYLSSFIVNIKRWTRSTGLLHPNFNQTIARTGRLSSSKPNFQNLPKGAKFPVRRCIISRFENGLIAEMDYSGVEFRVAGELSKDTQIIEDILTGKDVHRQTASIINQCDVSEVSKSMRQEAKAYTFAPLYGGMGMNEPQHVRSYFETYFQIYKGLASWHKRLMDGVLKDGLVRIPSGKRYMFENASRLPNGRITNSTAVVNYPVQGFAGIIMQLACVRALREFDNRKLRSKIILTVHDSLVADVHPDELEDVKEIFNWAMSDIKDEIKERFDYDFILPLDVEMEVGKNWMEMSEISLT